ncbi:MAG: SRPBCC domain-containing protein [Acidimicrobiales bacterium]
MLDAVLDSTGTRPVVRLERRLPRPPAEVWLALTDRDELAAWFPCDIITDEWKTDATLRFVFRGGEADDLDGTVLECDEPGLLAFTWGEETLRFEIAPDGAGSVLVLTDELPAAWAARNTAGWEACLERLEGRVPERDFWKGRFDRYVATFEPLVGHQEGPPPAPDP